MRWPSISGHRNLNSLRELQRALSIVATPYKSAVENKRIMAGRKAAGADDEQRERYIIVGAGGKLNLCRYLIV